MTIPVRSLRLLPKSKSELDRLSGNKGEIFYDGTSKSLRLFDGTMVGGTQLNVSVNVSDTPPLYPTQGSLWFNSANGSIYVYYQDSSSNQWIAPVVPTGGAGGGSNYTLPTASTSILGGVKVDGTSITINSGVISSSGLTSRSTVSMTTASLVNLGYEDAVVTAAKGYALYSIQVSAGAWVTIYSSAAARLSDSSRSITTDPAPSSGVIAEAISTIAATTYFTPAVIGFSAENNTNMYFTVHNNSGSTAAITVTITYLKLEN
jgi:hypothetical protein